MVHSKCVGPVRGTDLFVDFDGLISVGSLIKSVPFVFHITWRRSFFKHSYYVLSDLVTTPASAFRKRVL